MWSSIFVLVFKMILFALCTSGFAASLLVRTANEFNSVRTQCRGSRRTLQWFQPPDKNGYRKSFSSKTGSGLPFSGLHMNGKRNILNTDLLSKDEIDRVSELVRRRADARWLGDYAEADSLRDEIGAIHLPDGFDIVIKDTSRREGGASTWELVGSHEPPLEGPSVLQLAHAALGLAVASSERNTAIPSHQLNELVQEAKNRLDRDGVKYELRGRKAADAALWFALAGVLDESLFCSLAEVSRRELERFGARLSCRAKDIWHILERLAAAGVLEGDKMAISSLSRKLLKNKGDRDEAVVFKTQERESLLNLHSDRCLLMIWKFSTRQRKQRSFLLSALRHWETHERNGSMMTQKSDLTRSLQGYSWSDMFDDPSKPLVVDVGCGMGVSLLGMARYSEGASLLLEDWSECNLVGVDLSRLAIGYAQGMSHRQGFSHRLQFVVDSAEDFLQCIKHSYPGPVKLCLVQFPTPYRLPTFLDNEIGLPNTNTRRLHVLGNSQLPANATSGFMVTEALLRLIRETLQPGDEAVCGKLLLQSNCEDVAVWMRRTACEEADFRAMHFFGDKLETVQPKRIPKRTLDWIAMGGERAKGPEWSSEPILPRLAATETEVACIMNGTPVHRCVLVPGK